MERVVYKVGKFTDFAGIDRQVVFCAVSQDINSIIVEGVGIDEVEEIENGDFTSLLDCTVVEGAKVLRIGLSVQNPQDERADETLGKTIALGKAKKDKSCVSKIFSTSKGLINLPMVTATLDQELKYFQSNPGVYIKGYNKDKELFENNPNKYCEKYGISISKLSSKVLVKSLTNKINSL